jgi:hypothetical protein
MEELHAFAVHEISLKHRKNMIRSNEERIPSILMFSPLSRSIMTVALQLRMSSEPSVLRSSQQIVCRVENGCEYEEPVFGVDLSLPPETHELLWGGIQPSPPCLNEGEDLLQKWPFSFLEGIL